MLTWCLRDHPDVCAHGEVFGPDAPMNLTGLKGGTPLEIALRRLRDRDPMAFLGEVVLESGGRAAVGLKFKYEELVLPQWTELVDQIVADRSLAIIHLRRENLLERYLSQYIAVNVTKVFNTTKDVPRRHVAVTLSPDECEADFEQTRRREAEFADVFRGHQVLNLTYEQLTGRRDDALSGVQRFLEVDVRMLTPRSKKLRRASVRDSISNYNDLAAYFRGSPYAAHFLDG